MNNAQNKFYTSISNYYAEIFPYKPVQLKFVKNKIGNLGGKQILDIGCATGELAFQIAKLGAEVVAIDLNGDLLNKARKNKIHSTLNFQQKNMLEIKNDFAAGQFDAVLCFGNTLVHLQTVELVQQMLEGVNSVLKTGGRLLIQILNYDYICGEQVSELPLIETENIRFIRKYKFQEESKLIRFQTVLEIKEENFRVFNETLLLALKSKELEFLLKDTGFSNIQLFSNFKQDNFGGKHLPFVLSCEKN
ncbi:MAG: methyltransferase domain-containing protein [Bacteroidota bacterium]